MIKENSHDKKGSLYRAMMGWGKLIVLLIIGIIFLLVVILGLIQNYYALKAITSIPKMVNELDGNTTSLSGLNYITTSQTSTMTRTCYENDIKINCSEIDKYTK